MNNINLFSKNWSFKLFLLSQYLLGPLYAALKMESMEIIEEVQCQFQQENLSSNSDGLSPKRRRLSSSLNSSKRAPKQTEEYDLHSVCI